MATTPRYSIRDTKQAVDASKEIILDVMYLTADLMHAVRNHLPIDLTSAQVTLQGQRLAAPPTVVAEIMPRGRRVRAAVVLALTCAFLCAAVVGGVATVLSIHQKKVEASLTAAQYAAGKAMRIDVKDPRLRLQAAQAWAAAGDLDKVVALTRPLLSSRYRDEAITLLAPAWLKMGALAEIRSLVPEAGVNSAKSSVLIDSFHQSWELDPRMSTTPREISPDLVLPLEEGTYHVAMSGQAAILRVATDADPDSWQDPIAAYRLCLVMACEFDMPEAQFVTLMIEDQKTVGALITELGSGAPFPIENTHGWRHLLSGNLEDVSVERALRSWRRAENFDDVVRQAAASSSVELARQLSSLLVFDFLANNHARFASSRSEWGQTTRMYAGRIVSTEIDRQMFETRTSKRVRGRFNWIDKLPATQVANALTIDFTRLGGRLFPQETPLRSQKLYALARQQDALAIRSRELEKQLGFPHAFPF